MWQVSTYRTTGCPKMHGSTKEFFPPTAAMLMVSLLPDALPHCDPHGVRAVPKGCRGKLWQLLGGLLLVLHERRASFVRSCQRRLMSVVGVKRKRGASLFEKGKWETIYQFQKVVVNAPKFGQDWIEKSVGLTGKWYHGPIFVHSERCELSTPTQHSPSAGKHACWRRQAWFSGMWWTTTTVHHLLYHPSAWLSCS